MTLAAEVVRHRNERVSLAERLAAAVPDGLRLLFATRASDFVQCGCCSGVYYTEGEGRHKTPEEVHAALNPIEAAWGVKLTCTRSEGADKDKVIRFEVRPA